MEILRFISHYGLHFIVPGVLSWIFFRDSWKKAWIIMLLTMFVDLDHVLATPIFSDGRCSIGFHPLHSYYAIGGYFILLIPPKTRVAAMGLLLHMFADYQDCLWIEALVS